MVVRLVRRDRRPVPAVVRAHRRRDCRQHQRGEDRERCHEYPIPLHPTHSFSRMRTRDSDSHERPRAKRRLSGEFSRTTTANVPLGPETLGGGPRRRPRALRCRRTASSPDSRARISPPGREYIPAWSPSPLRTRKTWPSSSATTNATRTTGTRGFVGRTGNEAWTPDANARHSLEIGQSGHFGTRGTHTIAPSSMTAWFHSPGASSGTSSAATSFTRSLAGPRVT